MYHKRISGFTLIEVMVVLLITSIIAVSISLSLKQVARSSRVTREHAMVLEHLQMSLFMFSDDLYNALPVPGVDRAHPNFMFEGSPDSLLFVRKGQLSPMLIYYRIHNHNLEKKVSPYVYTKKDIAKYRLLMQGLFPIEGKPYLRYLGFDNLFYTSWPPPNKAVSTPPKAVQLAFHLKNWGDITQFYLLPESSKYEIH